MPNDEEMKRSLVLAHARRVREAVTAIGVVAVLVKDNDGLYKRVVKLEEDLYEYADSLRTPKALDG